MRPWLCVCVFVLKNSINTKQCDVSVYMCTEKFKLNNNNNKHPKNFYFFGLFSVFAQWGRVWCVDSFFCFFRPVKPRTCGTDKQLAHFSHIQVKKAIHLALVYVAHIRISAPNCSFALLLCSVILSRSVSAFAILFYLFVVLFNLSLSEHKHTHISNNSHLFIHSIVKCIHSIRKTNITPSQHQQLTLSLSLALSI